MAQDQGRKKERIKEDGFVENLKIVTPVKTGVQN
jgi:hypothetical protein